MASSSSSAEATPPWPELPREITAVILHKLGAIEILTTAQYVCATWRRVCQDPAMWRRIDMHNSDDRWNFAYDLEKICRHAVDRSQGLLIDINIGYFGTDDLLLYISRSSSQLRRLQLVFSYSVTGEGVTQAVKNLPLLEELHLCNTLINVETFETIGRCCPLLKTFKLNYCSWYQQSSLACDQEALAIAKNLPELHHLQLIGNRMTNYGLQAILDGCPHLKSLDLRLCYNVHFGGNLGRLCSQRIKDVRRPDDTTDDCGFDAESYDYETHDDDDDYITGFSDVDMVSDYDDFVEFSGRSVASDEFGDDVGFVN